MTTSAERPRGRDRHARSRPRVGRLVAAGTVAALVLGAAAYADSGGHDDRRSADALTQDWEGRAGGQQVLGGVRRAGLPSIQRLVHDDVQFTVAVAPARPGRNLVRVDTLHTGDHDRAAPPVLVGSDEDHLARARPRPGADGLWAVVDLPVGTGTVFVSHGPDHRIPFTVDTGGASPLSAEAWTGRDGPECLSAATAAVLAANDVPGCPAQALTATDAEALRDVVHTLAARGVTELALDADDSGRGTAARELVTTEAAGAGLVVVDPARAPGERNALLVVSGWADAVQRLSDVSARPVRRQPIRSDGTWLAPWLLTPGVVDSTAGATVPLGFDIRSEEAQRYSQTLARYLPGQRPTASGFTAWAGPGEGPVLLYAASRAAYMPSSGSGHAAHETTVAWFPGGTITPVGDPAP